RRKHDRADTERGMDQHVADDSRAGIRTRRARPNVLAGCSASQLPATRKATAHHDYSQPDLERWPAVDGLRYARGRLPGPVDAPIFSQLGRFWHELAGGARCPHV